VGRLRFLIRYLRDNRSRYIEWLTERGEPAPEERFRQEAIQTINLVLEFSNILLRAHVERFAYEKCGSLREFLKRYKTVINSCRLNYQRGSSLLSVLDINRDLRNYSLHSEPKYKLINSTKTPAQILGEHIVVLKNKKGEKRTLLLHDLDYQQRENVLSDARKEMMSTNEEHITYGELLMDEVIECIRQIDTSRKRYTT
jgi:hypothetical protein